MGREMINIKIDISSEYGIMFLYDRFSQPDIPLNAGSLPLMSTSNCVAFNVLTYVDGDASIKIGNQLSSINFIEYFSGEILCPSKSISLLDHNGFAYASVPLNSSVAILSIMMSEEKNPEFVECVIKNMFIF
jgi:hypothetical protein